MTKSVMRVDFVLCCQLYNPQKNHVLKSDTKWKMEDWAVEEICCLSKDFFSLQKKKGNTVRNIWNEKGWKSNAAMMIN